MSELITTLALIFIVSAVFLIFAKQVGIFPVPVYIIAGVLVSPLIGPGVTLELAQLGIAFLVFVFGVNIDPQRFHSVADDSETVAAFQLVVIGLLTFGIGMTLGLSLIESLYFSAAAALSSSLIGGQLTQDSLHLNLVHSRLTQSVHFVQDLFAILLILLLSATAFELEPIALKLGFGVMLLAGAVIIRVYLFELLINLSGGSDELITLTGIGLLIAFIGAADLLAVSIVVGAFAAGVSIPLTSSDSLSLLNGLESLESFFSAIFFVTLGTLVTTPTVETAFLATILVLSTVLVKPMVTIYSILKQGYETRTACLTSFSLDQVSEFALIIAIQGIIIGRISETLFEAIVLAAAITMITSAVTRQYDEELYQVLVHYRFFESAHEQLTERSYVGDVTDHVIIVGYGKLGIRAAQACDRLRQPYVVIDHDPDRLQLASEDCDNYVFGDAMSDATWEEARVSSARLIVSTTPDRNVSEKILSLRTDADVIPRAEVAKTALQLLADGAYYVSIPDFLASQQLVDTLVDILEGTIHPEVLRREQLGVLRRARRNNLLRE